MNNYVYYYSAMLRTSWPSNPELQGQSIVQLGISIEEYVYMVYIHTIFT